MSGLYPLHGGTVDQLRRQLADAKRAEQITAQLLDEARAELSRTRPMADAGHAYCAAWYVPGEESTGDPETDVLFAAHMATTPSPGPATHVVVEVKELERLRGIERDVANAKWERVDWGVHRSDTDEIVQIDTRTNAQFWVDDPEAAADYVVRREVRELYDPWVRDTP